MCKYEEKNDLLNRNYLILTCQQTLFPSISCDGNFLNFCLSIRIQLTPRIQKLLKGNNSSSFHYDFPSVGEGETNQQQSSFHEIYGYDIAILTLINSVQLNCFIWSITLPLSFFLSQIIVGGFFFTTQKKILKPALDKDGCE